MIFNLTENRAQPHLNITFGFALRCDSRDCSEVGYAEHVRERKREEMPLCSAMDFQDEQQKSISDFT